MMLFKILARRVGARGRRFLYTFDLMMPSGWGVHDVGLAGAKGGKKSAIACPSNQGFASDISTSRTVPCSCPPVRATDATACHRVILGRPSNSSGPPSASTRGSQSGALRMDLAARGPQKRLAFHVPHAPRAVPRNRSRNRSGILLRVRSTSLSPRLAH